MASLRGCKFGGNRWRVTERNQMEQEQSFDYYGPIEAELLGLHVDKMQDPRMKTKRKSK